MLAPAMSLIRHAAPAALLLTLSSAGCRDPQDVAAKERIFSPEEPAAEVRRAREALSVDAAATDPVVWRRIVTMDRREVTERIGAHRAQTEVRFRWSGDGRAVSLTETSAFETTAAGDFRARVENSEDAGLEFIWADGQAFARSRYGAFRARRIDRAQHDRWRDEATGALSTVFDLFDRRLRAAPLGPRVHEGRRGERFGLVLGEPWGVAPPERKLPPAVYGKVRDPQTGTMYDGPDEDTLRRLAFDARLVPREVQGEVLVDPETAVVLEARIEAQFELPGDGENEQPARLKLEVRYALAPAGDVVVRAPENVVAPRMPHAVDNPLGFLGAAPAAPAAPAEPADEAEGADEAD